MGVEQRDYAGGAIISAVLREQPDYSIIAAGGVDYRESNYGFRAHIEIIELLQTDERFEEVIRLAQRVAQVPEFDFLGMADQIHLLVDNTDGSARTAEILWEFDRLNTMAVVLTAEREQRYQSGQYYVPRRDVIADLVDSFQTGGIKVSEDLALSGMLESEITNLAVRTADEASALIIAVALIAWKAGKELPFEDYPKHDPLAGYDPANWGLRR